VAEAARERQQARDVAFTAWQQAQAALTSAEEAARAAATSESAAARLEADRIREELAQIRRDRENAQREYAGATRQDGGLLARIEALASLDDDRPDLWMARMALLLLFMSLELLPVLMKVIQLSGPPTVYDEIVERMEEEAKRAAARAAARDRHVADRYADFQVELEHDQAELQFEAGRRANRLLVAEQEAIAERAIRRWAAEAQRRSDGELDDWFRRDGAPRTNGEAPRAHRVHDDTIPFRRVQPE
jgi:hypothetical protein